MNDSQIQIQAYSYFLTEAPELLQSIEHEILTLPNEHTTAKVHNLMRSLHTLKGAAANVGLATIELISHQFEDVVRVFYNLELEIDVSIQSLLLAGYSALDECLNAQIMDREIDERVILDRVEDTLAQLKIKLGDWNDADIALPTAMELGFDIVASIFETTIQEQIDEIAIAISMEDARQISECLETATNTCISLAESFELPGFLAINQAIISAIANHPDRIDEIALIALANIQQAQADVLAGDRISGGNISSELAKLAEYPIFERSILAPDLAKNLPLEMAISQTNLVDEVCTIASGETELPGLQAFLISDRFTKRHEFSTDNQHLFMQIVRLCWDWFRHEIQPPQSQLNLEILITVEGLGDLDYIHHWIGLLLQGVKTGNDRSSLQLYRECCIYQVVYAVAKYLATSGANLQISPDLLTQLRSHLRNTVNAYKQEIPVTANERGWIDRIIIPHNWMAISVIPSEEDLLLSEVWGNLDLTKD